MELDVYIPGLATGVNFGTRKLEVRKINKKSKILEVIVCGNQFYQEGKTFKDVPLN